jgi:type IV pilus assembly protein PilQ
MSLKRLLSFLMLLALNCLTGAVAAAQQPKPVTAPSARPAIVRDVTIFRTNDGMQVEIIGNAALNGKVITLSRPERIVVDVENAVPSTSLHTIPVGTDGVKDIRTGSFQVAPPVTRVVVDLVGSRDYELQNAGNKLVLKLRGGMMTGAPVTNTPGIRDAKARVPRRRAVRNVASRQAPPLMQPRAFEPNAQSEDHPGGGARDFVFVEPAYQPKPDQDASGGSSAQSATSQSTDQGSQPKDVFPGADTVLRPVNQPSDSSAAAQPSQPGTQAPVNQPTPATPAPEPAQTAQAPAPSAQPTQPAPTAPAPDTTTPQNPSAAAGRVMSNMQEPTPATGSTPAQAHATNMAAQQQKEISSPPHRRKRYTGEPISVNLKDVDLKDFFRLIHEISGLNIVLDPNVHGSLTLVLDDVPWDQALDIVLQNNGLDKEIEGNVLRIATVDALRREADAVRAKEEAKALSVPKVTYTHYLSYAHSKDVLPVIKKFMSQRGEVVADDRMNGLIIQDIPSVIPEIQKLLIQLDRKTQEVEIEGRVVAATRNFARELGMQVGFGWGNGVSAVGGAGSVGTSPLLINGLTPSYFTLGNAIPLFSSQPAIGPTSGVSFSNATNNYRIDAILTMAESRGLLKILSRPRVVTQNNTQAVVRQGVRVPVVTAAQLGGPPTVTYVDAFLRLQVTPQITAENTIFLNVDVENTTPDFGHTVQGNPTLLTQQALTQVLVTDGGTVVIGGVIQTQNSVNTTQVPVLGDIPILGNAFKHRSVSTQTQELIFFLTPKIIQT